MRKLLDSVEAFFAGFVPKPLMPLYSIWWRYSVFVFGGLIGWLILIGSEMFFLSFGVWRGIGYAVGLVLAILFTFMYHRYVTFGVKSEARERFVRFAPLQVVIAALNWIFFIAATEYLGMQDVAASFVVTFVLSILNFAASRLLVFHRQ